LLSRMLVPMYFSKIVWVIISLHHYSCKIPLYFILLFYTEDWTQGPHLNYVPSLQNIILKFLFIYFVVLGLELRTSCLHEDRARALSLESLQQSFFCIGCFQERVWQTISRGWLWTVILLRSQGYRCELLVPC
jgi:hypothetical protein